MNIYIYICIVCPILWNTISGKEASGKMLMALLDFFVFVRKKSTRSP